MSSKSVYFIRHGQTLFNREQRLQGWMDSPLSPKGKQQAHQIASKIKSLNLGIQYAYVSPLGRAQQTADILRQELGFQLEIDDNLREVSFGDFEGNTIKELDEKFPGQWEARQSNKWNYRPPGGEANKDAVPRAKKIVERIQFHPNGSSLLIIAHFAINRMILSLLAGISPEETMQMNVPHEIIYRAYQMNGQWRIGYYSPGENDGRFKEGWLIQHRPENLPMGA